MTDELEKLLVACGALPPTDSVYLATDYVSCLLDTVIDFQQHTTTVRRAIAHFNEQCWDHVRTLEDLQAVLARFPDTKEGNTVLAQYLWGYPLADPTSTFIFGPGSAALLNLNVGAAKANKAKKVSVVAIDVPAATAYYKTGTGPTDYQKAGVQMELIPVAAGTADMTPQMQSVASGNPKGVVFVIGNDSFCIAAFNGLRTAGFKGTVTAVPSCLSDATRTAVPADFLEGIQIAATAPIDTPKDPSMKQYYAVLDKYGASSVDKTRSTGVSMFQGVSGVSVATQNLKGDPTPASVIAAAKSMPWSVLPGSGGIHIRCNGKANPAQPAVCATGTLAATLNAEGKATKYTKVGDTEIPA